jgi:hypothetical protein
MRSRPGPLVADLALPHLLGRYISVFSLMVTAPPGDPMPEAA